MTVPVGGCIFGVALTVATSVVVTVPPRKTAPDMRRSREGHPFVTSLEPDQFYDGRELAPPLSHPESHPYRVRLGALRLIGDSTCTRDLVNPLLECRPHCENK